MTSRFSEDMVQKIATMDRGNLVAMLRELDCPFKIDFTDEFLTSISIERLRHIVLAASLHRIASHSSTHTKKSCSVA